MSITIAVGGTTVTLNPDLFWEDEHDWHPVVQSVERTITGALIVSSAALVAGRPITLRGFDDSSAWMTQTVLTQLRNWAAVAGQQLTLTIRGVARTVIFRHHEGSAVEAEPVVHYSDVESTDYYRMTLRFTEV